MDCVMVTVDLLQRTGSRMLGTRPEARAMKPAMLAAARSGEITLNTTGVRRIGVSFFDEALLIFDELVSETDNRNLKLIYRKAPPTDSLRQLVYRKGLRLSETSEGDWVISK